MNANQRRRVWRSATIAAGAGAAVLALALLVYWATGKRDKGNLPAFATIKAGLEAEGFWSLGRRQSVLRGRQLTEVRFGPDANHDDECMSVYLDEAGVPRGVVIETKGMRYLERLRRLGERAAADQRHTFDLAQLRAVGKILGREVGTGGCQGRLVEDPVRPSGQIHVVSDFYERGIHWELNSYGVQDPGDPGEMDQEYALLIIRDGTW